VQVFNIQQNTLYRRAFIKITISKLCKHMMSQFDDRLITGYGKTMTGLKKFDFYNPNPNFAKTFTNGKTTMTGLSLH